MKFLFLILLSLSALVVTAQQTYNPTKGTASNKPYAPSQAVPTDSRTYFYDSINFVWRPYVSTSEVKSYLNLSKYRIGQFDIVVNTGGTLASGVITGGTNALWYFKNGTADSNLVLKSAIADTTNETYLTYTQGDARYVKLETQAPTATLNADSSYERRASGTGTVILNYTAGRQAATVSAAATATLSTIVVNGVSRAFTQPAGENTAERIGGMLEAIIDNKINNGNVKTIKSESISGYGNIEVTANLAYKV